MLYELDLIDQLTKPEMRKALQARAVNQQHINYDPGGLEVVTKPAVVRGSQLSLS